MWQYLKVKGAAPLLDTVQQSVLASMLVAEVTRKSQYGFKYKKLIPSQLISRCFFSTLLDIA